MRTQIDLDDSLVEEALSLSHFKTKRELVDAALREFVAQRKRLNLRDLKGIGSLRRGYDYKSLRAGKSRDGKGEG